MDHKKERDLYWDPTRPTKKKKKKKEVLKKKQKQKADVFQRVIEGIIQIIIELWLECNTDRHRPLKGKQRIAKISGATQIVTDLYSLRSLIIPQHESRYFEMPLEEMLEQSALRMLAWTTRWKIGIY